MKRVLLLTNPKNADTTGSVPVSSEKIRNHVLAENGINMGNKLFVTATEQYLTKPDISYVSMPYQEVIPESIKDCFDFVVAPMANMFNFDASKKIENITAWIRKAQIPVYILGCGIESGNSKELKKLFQLIAKDVAKYMDAIYESGGEIATRGYITKEFLDKCGENTAVATGCPSFYRNGDIEFKKNDVSNEDFRVAFVSCDYPDRLLRRNLEKYPRSMLIDQETFMENYYIHEDFAIIDRVKALQKQVGAAGVKAFCENKVYPATEIPLWLSKLSQFNFAYGSRIHGINAALEAKIPMKIVCKSLRTLEMAEYIGIPRTSSYKPEIDLYNEYQNLDLQELNRKYKKGLQVFEQFLYAHGISYDISNHEEWDKQQRKQHFSAITVWNQDDVEKFRRQFERKDYPIQYYLYKVKCELASRMCRGLKE